jgi:hypothetical protein
MDIRNIGGRTEFRQSNIQVNALPELERCNHRILGWNLYLQSYPFGGVYLLSATLYVSLIPLNYIVLQ